MGFRIYCITNNCKPVTSDKLKQNVSSEIDSRNLVTEDQLQQNVSTQIDNRNIVTADQLQQNVSTEITSRNLVTTDQLQQTVSSEINSRNLVTIDQLNEQLQQFISNPQSEVNKIKIIDISNNLLEQYYLQNGDEFVVLVNDNQVTGTTSTIYLPSINQVTGIEITIINLSGNDANLKTLADDIDDIDNGDYFYDSDTPLQSSILLCPNYSLRFISYTSNRWVNIV